MEVDKLFNMDEKDIELMKCRVCLSHVGTNCLSLFENYRNSTLFIYINTIANVDIAEGDGFPTNVCKSCFLEFETAVNFKEKCQQTNEILHANSVQKIDFPNFQPEVLIKSELNEDCFVETQYSENDDVPDEEVKIEKRTEVKAERIFTSRSINLKLKCNECGEMFKSKCKLGVHWKKVHLPQALVCPDCKSTYRSFKTFNKHRRNPPRNCIGVRTARIEGQGKSRIFHCTECNYKTPSAEYSMSHAVVHTGEKKFQCNYCNKYFTQCSSLTCHKEIVHKEFRVQITCQFCGKEVKGRSNIYSHLKTHTDNHHECTVCKKVVSNKKNLQLHMKRHMGVKDYTCHICARNFYTQGELSTHVRKRHSNKPAPIFNCELCSYKTPEKYVLKKHVKRHTATNFACGICNSFFDDEERVKKHIHNHKHKKYKCDLCDARFAFQKSLWKHGKLKHSKLTSITKPNVAIKKELVVEYLPHSK